MYDNWEERGRDFVSTHSRLKAAEKVGGGIKGFGLVVSTHSRLKAADPKDSGTSHAPNCFNTQPPEGG